MIYSTQPMTSFKNLKAAVIFYRPIWWWRLYDFFEFLEYARITNMLLIIKLHIPINGHENGNHFRKNTSILIKISVILMPNKWSPSPRLFHHELYIIYKHSWVINTVNILWNIWVSVIWYYGDLPLWNNDIFHRLQAKLELCRKFCDS